MPVLMPAASPPSNSSSSRKISHEAPPEPSQIPTMVITGNDTQVSASPNKFPVVSLDVDAISDDVAARLAISLLGHVLYLKGQVPMPVAQLARMSSAKTSPRALKQRNELLSSYDTLMSHFNTTFTSLSSTMAKIAALKHKNVTTSARIHDGTSGTPDRCRTYVAIVVGSSVTASASSRVILAVDGLEVKAIGVRDDIPPVGNPKGKEEEEGESEDEDEDEVDEARGGDGDDELELENESGSEEVDESDPEDEEGTESDIDDSSDLPPDSPPPSQQHAPHPTTYAEQQKALQAVERLLSKTLLLADAEGNGLSADMSPTQIHILIRAPRRFSHPAWVPRQNFSASLESSLDEFLVESGVGLNEGTQQEEDESDRRKKRPAKKKKSTGVWGVWVTPRGGLDIRAGKDRMGDSSQDENRDEWDEMIWWSWDGKLAGFIDW